MFSRLLTLPTDESVLLFGPRSTGKTTYLKNLPIFKHALYINLLLAKDENTFRRNPDELIAIAHNLPENISHIIIDEVQKIPKLLDIVHHLIETTRIKFILTGSSARRLKEKGTNLLAGRALVYRFFPLTYQEVSKKFELEQALRWGMLPKLFDWEKDEYKIRFLEAYTNTYLKEEIWLEQFVRDLSPFQHFLQVAAQSNGKLINFSNIARDVGTSDNTVTKYYSILEDTLIGFFLRPFQHSFRKRLSKSPKFFFFDNGVVRTLSGQISLPLAESTSAYGEAFEHFIILQCQAMANFYQGQYQFYFLHTKEGAEIDLIVKRPGLPYLFIEIKSTDNVQASQLNTLKKTAKDFGDCEAICFSRDRYPKTLDSIKIFPWKQGIEEYFC